MIVDLKKKKKEAIAEEIWDAGGLAQGGCRRGGEKQPDSSYIFTCKKVLPNS